MLYQCHVLVLPIISQLWLVLTLREAGWKLWEFSVITLQFFPRSKIKFEKKRPEERERVREEGDGSSYIPSINVELKPGWGGGKGRQIATLGNWANSLQPIGAHHFLKELTRSSSLLVLHGKQLSPEPLISCLLEDFSRHPEYWDTFQLEWSRQKRDLELCKHKAHLGNCISPENLAYGALHGLAVFPLGMNSMQKGQVSSNVLLGKQRP